MDEMIITPDGAIIIILPLQVDIQVGQMITLGDSKLLPDLIALLLSALGREKDPNCKHRESRPTARFLELFTLSVTYLHMQLQTHQCVTLTVQGK